jgi:hypothetical protein
VVEALPTRSQTDDLRRWTVQEGQLTEVGILRGDDEVMVSGVLPDLLIRRRIEADVRHVVAARKHVP